MTLRVADRTDLADVAAFLTRVVRLDAGALVRLRPGAPGRVVLWAWLPLDVLATRAVAGRVREDVTVDAAALLAVVVAGHREGRDHVDLPERRDASWRGSLPSGRDDRELDAVPADVVQRLVAAGEAAFRTVTADPQAAGQALLDHETLRVSSAGDDVVVPLRLLLGLARMGFLGEGPARVGVDAGWVRVTGRYGTVYRRRADVSRPALALITTR